MKKSNIWKWLFLLVIAAGLIIWIAWGNTALELNEYQIKSSDLPENFEGFRIAQVSDLHNAEIGEENVELLDMLEKAEPDIIVITGDMIDSRRLDIELALEFAKQVVEISPCYYVTGNHESYISEKEYLKFEEGLREAGIQVLHNEEIVFERGETAIAMVGVDDPAFASKYAEHGADSYLDSVDEMFSKNGFQILLSHRPELFQTYVDAGVDLVFSGHAHGGQFRLPFIGGLYAPHQGVFPVYDAELFSKNGTNMLVSRGIGNSVFPFRVNNRPEVVVVELIGKE